jgi:hypothetical protein
MVEELEISAIKLAQSDSGRYEMANRWHMRLKPLTPMLSHCTKLRKKFNPETLKSYKKMKDY